MLNVYIFVRVKALCTGLMFACLSYSTLNKSSMSMSMAIYDFPGIEDQDSLSPLWSSLQRGNLQKVLGTKENFIVEYHKK